MNFPLLENIFSPTDLRKMPESDLSKISEELRQFIIHFVAEFGGHLGASLGVVELTVALHYVFNTPQDQLIWDVGHQAYGHKILTERRANFHTNRRKNGIAGFPNRKESIFDSFGTGHSSTSISAALGMAKAAQILGKTDQIHIAVIGDGAITAGMAFEALNHAGFLDQQGINLLIILNENGMSIDPNVGALSTHFKNIDPKNNFFTNLQIAYEGIIDGHDLDAVLKVLKNYRQKKGIQVLHIRTVKGKGYDRAENDQVRWHATGTFNKLTGKAYASQANKPLPMRYQDVFGHTLLELAQANDKIVGVTPAMPSGSSMRILMEALPERAFDVGIAEQHAVTFSAGLATQSLTPFCSLYSTFMQRGYDQIIHDVCLQNLPVVFCVDRAGLVGEDGATHHGFFDLAFLRCLPNAIVCAPINESELRNMMFTAQFAMQPIFIRYPRGEGVLLDWKTPFELIPIGKAKCIQKGTKTAILSIGHIGNLAREACKELAFLQIFPAHYDMRFVKPLDEELLHFIAKNFDSVITLEDGCLQAGFGSAILEFFAENQCSIKVQRLGIPNIFVEHGKINELQEDCGLSVKNLVNMITFL
ncbi:MAG: 1-deoxy-D-xylulose-5-phosphate synthase [Bacteroidetes bacterium]|nr:MAG: 1-deoxy-D-xylulose-5-phosphate synthase [Bacteroidota bacterium]